MLDYEKLDVYRIALEFVITTAEIRDRLPRGNGELQVQFKRASSLCLQGVCPHFFGYVNVNVNVYVHEHAHVRKHQFYPLESTKSLIVHHPAKL